MQGLMMDYQLTIDRLLEHGNCIYPHKQIITKQPDGSMYRYTYADMYKRVKRLANVLVNEFGITTGDRVATFAWNNYQHVELYYGIPVVGAVCHTLNIRLSTDQLVYIINHAEDKVIFIDGTLVPLFERFVDQLTTVEHYVLFNAPKTIETKIPNVLFYEDLLADADEAFEWRCNDENMAAGLCYTSGTTGEPKGALYSHRSTYLHAYGTNQTNALGMSEQDVVLQIVPQFHVMAWGFPYSCLMAGSNMVMPGPHLRPDALADLVEQEKVTIANGVPTIWLGVYRELKARPRDVSSLKELVVGGSALPRSLIVGYLEDFGIEALHVWGMTEMSPLGTASRLQTRHDNLSLEQKYDIRAKQGVAMPGVELRVAYEDGTEVPQDGETVGEFQVRGPWIISSYFKETANPESFTPDGWFRTGDVGILDADGYMQITDRTKDLIKSGGEWISSVALESALMGHPQVAEAAVIAIPHEQWGERPLATVVLAEDADDITGEELKTFLAPKFAKYQLPDLFAFIKEVPKTSVGKFNKKELRKQYAAGELI